MIPRYSRPDMVAIWEPATKFKIWYEIEAHACDAMADLGVIPRENADAVWKAKDVEFDVARIDEIEADLDDLLAALKKRALEHKNTVRVGRSHGIHAEPTTMGLTFARFYAEMDRNRDRLKAARAEIATGAISGAVGTFANVDPAVEAHVCAKLGLSPEPISTQVIPRDRHRLVHRKRRH